MRLLIAVLSPGTARRIAAGMEIRGFDALIAPNGTQALKLLSLTPNCTASSLAVWRTDKSASIRVSASRTKSTCARGYQAIWSA